MRIGLAMMDDVGPGDGVERVQHPFRRASHALNASRSRVIVPKVRTSWVAVPVSVLVSTQATTVF